MREDILKGISEELFNKAKACKSPEEIFALAKEEGIELTEEQLEAVSGGFCEPAPACSYCGSTNTRYMLNSRMKDIVLYCYDCKKQKPYNPMKHS